MDQLLTSDLAVSNLTRKLGDNFYEKVSEIKKLSEWGWKVREKSNCFANVLENNDITHIISIFRRRIRVTKVTSLSRGKSL